MNVIKELVNGLGSRRAAVERSLWFFSLGIQQMYASARESHQSSPWFGNRPGEIKSWPHREWAEIYHLDYEICHPDYEGEYEED